MVDVVNPSVDFSIIGGLGDVYKQAQQQAQKDAALAQLRANPNMGYDQSARTLIGGGDIQGGSALAGIYNQIQQRALAEKQLAEQQRHSQATEGPAGSRACRNHALQSSDRGKQDCDFG
jgi:hypothetical protein